MKHRYPLSRNANQGRGTRFAICRLSVAPGRLFLLVWLVASAAACDSNDSNDSDALVTSAPTQETAFFGATDSGPVEYFGELGDELIHLTFTSFGQGPLTGVILGLDTPLRLLGERRGTEISGELDVDGVRLPVLGTIENDSLRLRIGPSPEDGEIIEAELYRGGVAAFDAPAFDAPASLSVATQPAERRLMVNGEWVSEQTRAQLEGGYGLRIEDGTYWYDPTSGWWGYEGAPGAGQLPPGLPLGGALRADASGSGTGVYFNGRELHPIEVQQLQLVFGQVPRMRFWLNAQGVGGPEGGPATFNLQAAAGGQTGQGGSGQGGLRRGPGGTTGSDGECSFFNDPSTGASVMTGNC
jgi:hypothetical protein